MINKSFQPRYRGKHLTGGRLPSQRKESKMPTEKENLDAAQALIDRPWLSGRPYYCNACGLGGPEVQACEDGPCEMESAAEAQARRSKFLREQSVGK